MKRSQLVRWPVILAALFILRCHGDGGPSKVEACPDRARMYRDYSVEGSPCLCQEPDIYVLNSRRDLCIECIGDCNGTTCGDDGCGRLCGECPLGQSCDGTACIRCQPNCAARSCGDDGCGRSCGTCAADETCRDGTCEADQPAQQVGATACCTPFGSCILFQTSYLGQPCFCVNAFGQYAYGTSCQAY